ncbi:hypothetical protein Gbth_024_134 [Gluconobacter thailandicus F149-1 = NBRC 100600]|uniref:Flagellar FliJ protein n=1 Tax=Gluconobacter thailandicus NBRC 3257 TaxID=1381097 RepID=A0ABQ0IZR3_GLUTH|nr:flagellar FliJ family protein [Gluconobacter thailandicus]KXV51872.1 hypothetical protein AD946_15290 [Gluconobacter thailandicus]GAC87378.1 hypothetical protein NBRC3255_1039 [Gluconobacter thailandicus NBRC 3255]GAD27018.1 hypothetical protein NBRC3257_2017 [Gluconobacter thailandicus NBRC 3257]GAN93435.1 hypothetical protein Gbth_024_134 [Gluconobacter thailandicus F149-1 = NBRC 100600]GBR57915.1 hypothetical protein AA100600_0505 [Gluconobacter thailandicus F149-1 = NBRC 100600]
MRQMPLEVLRRLRRHELADVEKAFGEAVAREAAAETALGQRHQDLLMEQKLASDPLADDRAVEAFSRWLPVGQRAISEAQERCRQAAIDRDCIRSALLMAQAALKAVEKLEEKQQGEIQQHRLRKEQAVLDELALRQRNLH